MEEIDIARLYKKIKRRFPAFDASLEAVKDDHQYLKDIDYETAIANVDKHVLTKIFPPSIAEIRGTVHEQSERYVPSVAETRRMLAQQPNIKAVPPTKEQLERVRKYVMG